MTAYPCLLLVMVIVQMVSTWWIESVWRPVTSVQIKSVSLTVTARTMLAVFSLVRGSSASVTWAGSWTGAMPAHCSAHILGHAHLLVRMGVRGHLAMRMGGCQSVRTVTLLSRILNISIKLDQGLDWILLQVSF